VGYLQLAFHRHPVTQLCT